MILFDLPAFLAYPYLFVLGCIVGSFLNVCIYRIPQHDLFWTSLRSVGRPPSTCPRCRTRIRWHDNIPVVGWLRLRGRCRDCRMWISPRYPVIELLNGLLWVALYWWEVPAGVQQTIRESGIYSPIGPQGFTGSTLFSPQAVVHWRFFYHLVLVEALVVASFIDWDLWIIPDGVTLPAMAVGVIGGVLVGQVHLVPVWFQSPTLLRDIDLIRDLSPEYRWMFPGWLNSLLVGSYVPAWVTNHPHLHGLAVSVAGLIAGGGVVWVVRIIGHAVLKQEAMGFGDVVLMAMVGSFLGWQPTLVAFFLAPVLACLVVLVSLFFRRHRKIPYGPYLSLGTLVVLFCWEQVWPPFERVFAMGILVIPIGVVMILSMTLMLIGIQGVKWGLGIDLIPMDEGAIWTAADQSQYLASEQVDHQQGRWRQQESPGILSGRGQIHEDRWRRP